MHIYRKTDKVIFVLCLIAIVALFGYKVTHAPTYCDWKVGEISSGDYPATGKMHPVDQYGTWIRFTSTNNQTLDRFYNPFKARKFHVGDNVNYLFEDDLGGRSMDDCVEGMPWSVFFIFSLVLIAVTFLIYWRIYE